MKTKTTLISALSLALLCVSSYAETIYFYTKDAISTWPFLADESCYVDENGQRVDIDWNANVYDVVIDFKNMKENPTKGVDRDWHINSLTIQKGDGSAFDNLWWANEEGGQHGEGKTLTINNDFNIYAGVRNQNWKRFALKIGGDWNVAMPVDTGDGGMFEFVGLKSLSIGDLDAKTGSFILSKATHVMFKDVREDATIGRDVKIEAVSDYIDMSWYGSLSVGNDFKVSNVGGTVILAHIGDRSDFAKSGMTVGGNLILDDLRSGLRADNLGFLDVGGDISVTNIKIGAGTDATIVANFEYAGKSVGKGISVANNALFSDIEGHLKFNNARSFNIGGNLEVHNLVNADGTSRYDLDLGAIGNYADETKGTYIAGNLTVSNLDKIQMHNSRNVYIGGDFTASNMDWANMRNIGIYNGEVVGGLEIVGNVDFAGYGLSIEQNASTKFHKNVSATRMNANGSGLLDGVQVGIIEVGQNLAVTYDASIRETGHLKVGGDFSVGGNLMLAQYFGADGNAVSADNVGVDVGGQINLGSGKMGAWFYADAEDPDKYGKEMFVKADGITATEGSLYMTNEKGTLGEVYNMTYILKGSKDASYTGGIYQYVAGAEGGSPTAANPDDLDNMKLNIIKNGAGTQSLIVNGVGSMWRGTVTLNEGRLNLYMLDSDYVKVDLVLNQGTVLDVAYEKQGPHNPSTDYMGYIRAGKVEINGDTQIWFDVSSNPYYTGYESDWIKADEVTGTGVATLMIDLDVNYFSAGQVLEDFEFRIFEIADNSYDWAQALVKIMYGGSDITYQFSKHVAYFKDGSVYVDLTGIVPEPASVAALFGAVAMGFVLLRRRRK